MIFSADVQLLIDLARKGFDAGSDIAWLQAAHAAIGHRKDGGEIEDNPFDIVREKRLHEAWGFYFNAGQEKRTATWKNFPRAWHVGSTQAAHAAQALED